MTVFHALGEHLGSPDLHGFGGVIPMYDALWPVKYETTTDRRCFSRATLSAYSPTDAQQ